MFNLKVAQDQTNVFMLTHLHEAQAAIPSVNIRERSSVHRAGGRHLQRYKSEDISLFITEDQAFLQRINQMLSPTSAHVRRHPRQKTWQQLSGMASSPPARAPRQTGHFSGSSASEPSDGPPGNQTKPTVGFFQYLGAGIIKTQPGGKPFI